MEGCWNIILFGGLLYAAIYFTAKHIYERREEEIRRRAEERRQRRLAEERAQALLALGANLRTFFPFLPPPAFDELDPAAIQRSLLEVLESGPTLGHFGDPPALPAPVLPARERSRHLYIVGKTGSGKSTYLEHLIAHDLEAGRGVGVIGPEGEFFRERLLPLVPKARFEEVIYFAPGDPENPLAFNPLALEPGEDQIRASEDLFTIFKRIFSEEELGPRMQPILQNAFAALVGRPGATLWEVKRLLEDGEFRGQVAEGADPYVRSFWLDTYPRYPKNADVPILNRLDRFLRPPSIRRTLCQPRSSFSIREALARGQILFLDLFGLSEENRQLFGQLLLAKFQLELMRRELLREAHKRFFLYADEFQSCAGMAEGTWRELLSRGRKYGVCLTLAHQYPAQLPTGLQDEILGNVNSLVAFGLGGRDANVVRRELLQARLVDGEERVQPLSAPALIEQGVGRAYAKFAGGRAVPFKVPPPLQIETQVPTREVIAASWARQRSEPLHDVQPPRSAEPEPTPEEPEQWRG